MAQTHADTTTQALGKIFSQAVKGQLTWDDHSQELMLELVRRYDSATPEEQPSYVQAILLSIDALKDPSERFEAVKHVYEWACSDSDLERKVFKNALPLNDILPPEERFDAACWVWSNDPHGRLEAADKAFAAIGALPPERRLEAAEWVHRHATSLHTDGDLEKKAALGKKAQAMVERLKPRPTMSIDEFVAEMQALAP